MHIAFLALGTRGDVQPYVALGKGLVDAGHEVRLVSHVNYETLIDSYGLSFHSVKGNVQDVVESVEMRALVEKGNFIAITRQTAREAQRAALQWAEDGLAACQGADLIIAGIGGLFIGIALAEKLGIPLLQAYLLPFSPTTAFPGVLLPASMSRLGGGFNRLSHGLTRQLMWQGFRAADTAARRVLDLPAAPLRGPFASAPVRDTPILYGFSPSVVPQPPDWDENTHVTGYWFLDAPATWTPPPSLTAFLDAGQPPVYVGFGSMSSRKPGETAELVIKALSRAGQRGIVLSGWGGLTGTDLPDSVLMIDSVPHDWLFPRVAAVVHHGGAGTTAYGLRAGVPSVLIPFFGDQPFWGQRVAGLGAGPEPISRRNLKAEHLAAAITAAVTDQTLRRSAARLGKAIRAEDGIGRAVDSVAALSL